LRADNTPSGMISCRGKASGSGLFRTLAAIDASRSDPDEMMAEWTLPAISPDSELWNNRT